MDEYPPPSAEDIAAADQAEREIRAERAARQEPSRGAPPLAAYTEDARRHADGNRDGRGDGGAAKPQVGPVFFSAAALWGMLHPPTRWAVRGILPEGVTILGGKPKVGKSWLALDLATAIGKGALALETVEVEAGPVLYLALEDNKRRLTKRLRILCGAIPPAEQIEFITECPRLGSGGEDVLRDWLREHPAARLVVIDTLPRFRPHANAKQTLYANDYAVGEYLSGLCVEHQVSILVLAHSRKQPGEDAIDEISGTLGLVGGVDGYMVLRRQAMSDDATLYVEGRDIEQSTEYCIAWNRDHARWALTDGDPLVSRLPPEQRRAYELLSEAPRNIKELTEALNPGHVVEEARHDTRRKACARLVYKLKDKGLVGQGAYDGRWRAISTKQGSTSSSSSTGSTGSTGSTAGDTGATTELDCATTELDCATTRENVSDCSARDQGNCATSATSASSDAPAPAYRFAGEARRGEGEPSEVVGAEDRQEDGLRYERVVITLGAGTKEHRSFVSGEAPGGMTLAAWEAKAREAHGDSATVRPVPQ